MGSFFGFEELCRACFENIDRSYFSTLREILVVFKKLNTGKLPLGCCLYIAIETFRFIKKSSKIGGRFFNMCPPYLAQETYCDQGWFVFFLLLLKTGERFSIMICFISVSLKQKAQCFNTTTIAEIIQWRLHLWNSIKIWSLKNTQLKEKYLLGKIPAWGNRFSEGALFFEAHTYYLVSNLP